jgi:hypothetical protein
MLHKRRNKKKRDKNNIINAKENIIINSDIESDRYIYLMGLIGISPVDAKKDMANVKIDKIAVNLCSWKGYCKRCGMVHIE